MGKIVFTRKAAADLNDIWDYTYDTWSAEQANTYYNNLLADCGNVADKPEKLGRHYDDVRPAVKGFPSGKHIIFFRKLQDGRVRIIRILPIIQTKKDSLKRSCLFSCAKSESN